MPHGKLEVFGPGKETVRFELVENKPVVVGRTEESEWVVPFERFLSRQHLELNFHSGHLSVTRLKSATNPIFYRGKAQESFTLNSGGKFVVGKTQFVFTTATQSEVLEKSPLLRYSMSLPEVYNKSLTSDRMRLWDLLELPEILRLKSPAESFSHVASLLRSVSGGSFSRIAEAGGKILGMNSTLDHGQEPKYSEELVKEALAQSPHPTLYTWNENWAICATYQVPGESPLVFYVGGIGGNEKTLKEGCRLAGLIADMVGRSLSVARLESFKRRLERFFSSAVVSKIIETPDAKDLEPRLTEGTVMFFDIRGFSRLTESSHKDILLHVHQLKEVMTALTEEILKENGVVLQFLGDGILACWNVPFSDPDHINQACRAALGMVDAMGRVAPSWRCGIGIHTGDVIAGPMGAKQLFSYTVMGAVVNQASRVEGITKTVEVPILITKEVANKLTPGVIYTRRVGRFVPVGMDTALDLYHISGQSPNQNQENLFTLGLTAFEAGEWEKAYEILDKLPSQDRSARYLKSIAEMYRRHPPKNWHGAIELAEK